MHTKWIFISFTFIMMVSCNNLETKKKKSISAYAGNPHYWEYNGEPVLLLGGSDEDNMFNHPDKLADELDLVRACGGNYIRNTMSSRNPGNPWAFKRLDTGFYDLDQWDEEYWDRFENLLTLCLERDIIVQVEIWDPWDYFKSEATVGFGDQNVGWESCPFNPSLNINYTSAETGLADTIDYTLHTPFRHLFFQTPPTLKDIPQVRKYQEAFLDKLLSISFNFPNVLYCMRNECRESVEWSRHWASFIRKRADEEGIQVFLTDMRRSEDFGTPEQIDLLHDRIHFDFIDVSQNSHNTGQHHYDQIIALRKQVKDNPIPMNNVKIYGGTTPWTSGIEEGTRRFWRNVFSGCASARFHRPGPSENFFGIGISDLAQTHIRSVRMLQEKMSFFGCRPGNDLLSDRTSNEAYCLANEGIEYAIYFPEGGKVNLKIENPEKNWQVYWLDILASEWSTPLILDVVNFQAEIFTPGTGQWAALVLPSK